MNKVYGISLCELDLSYVIVQWVDYTKEMSKLLAKQTLSLSIHILVRNLIKPEQFSL